MKYQIRIVVEEMTKEPYSVREVRGHSVLYCDTFELAGDMCEALISESEAVMDEWEAGIPVKVIETNV